MVLFPFSALTLTAILDEIEAIVAAKAKIGVFDSSSLIVHVE
jgi:hypothetical protein